MSDLHRYPQRTPPDVDLYTEITVLQDSGGRFVLYEIVTGEIQIEAPPLAAERMAVACPTPHRNLLLIGLLGVLAILPYLPVLVQPFISDDYVQLALGRKYGPVAEWSKLFSDPLYRCRATSILLTHWTEQLFGTSPPPFYVTSLLLHVANTWLLLAVGVRFGLGRTQSYLAAAFFAVYLGHQEAVMWYAAVPELLLFLFCGLFLLSWAAMLRRGSPVQYGLALVWFVLALLSKEAGVILVPVAAVMAWRQRKSLWTVAPLAALAALYTIAIFAAKSEHLHLNDGTFSLHAPFVQTWVRSLGRMFWFWGLLGMAAIGFWQRHAWRRLAGPAIWMGIAILPFCFLTYMPVVPSRHTYLASAGIGFVVAAGLLAAQARFRAQRWVLPLLFMAMIVHHSGYILVKKRRQFLERAIPTEQLIELAASTDQKIYVGCFPYTRDVAESAIAISLANSPSRLVWNTAPSPGAVTFCAKDP